MSQAIPDNSAAKSSVVKGKAAESIAAAYVQAAGWTLLERNFRGRRGEIDLIIGKTDLIAFVEVKQVDAFGNESLYNSVNSAKQHRIIETSKLYLSRHREYTYSRIRYDVITIKALSVELWLEAAFAE
ncbi:MAG: YraN family protein [Spirochaetes bacterium]|nr:YraN family protein [Spirochaetota bacterium]MBU0955018.1 YraN family protein [Spirochaetota bacterium]